MDGKKRLRPEAKSESHAEPQNTKAIEEPSQEKSSAGINRRH